MNLSMRQKQNHRHREQAGGSQGKEVWGGAGMKWKTRVSSCKLLYTEWMINKVLLYGTKNYIQQPMINHNGEEFLRKNAYIDIYIYETRAESLCSISIINTTL